METQRKFRKHSILILLLLFGSALSQSLSANEDTSSLLWPPDGETPQQRQARMKWWKEAKFGMFIHWGIYSVMDGIHKGQKTPKICSWSMWHLEIPVAEYKEYAKQFNPTHYDPESWVLLAKEAGMKYIVITTKHHEGFALFDSKVTDWDMVDATPHGKDLIKPLAEACHKHKMPLGFYYSQSMDWCHRGGATYSAKKKIPWDPEAQAGDMTEYIREIAVPQVREILTNYGDVAILWWDTGRAMKQKHAEMLLPLMSLQPEIIINNRLMSGFKGDFGTPEQKIPPVGLDYDWETCMTMNDTWGYKSYDHNWKSTESLIHNLADIASKGGNYLLNVGPTPEGDIPQASIERLKEIGKWMKVNGESIYGTTASPLAPLDWGRCTKKVNSDETTLYLHVFNWPKNGKLLIPGLENTVRSAYLLGDKKMLNVEATEEGIVVNVPQKAPDEYDTVIVLEVKGTLETWIETKNYH